MSQAHTAFLLLLLTFPRSASPCLISPEADGRIEWPKTLRELPADSFRGCQFLKEVSVPPWVTNIGAYAFAACPILTSVVFEDSDEAPSRLVTIGAGAFQDTLISSVVLPRSLKYIGDEAFQYVPNLETVHIPASVIVLGRSSFRCGDGSTLTPSKLRVITFGEPSHLVLMESAAFDGCTKLEQVSVPPSCFVEENAFRGTASAYIKAPYPPSPPSPPPALKPGEVNFQVEMQQTYGIAARVGAFILLMLACMCAACLCKARKAPPPPPPPPPPTAQAEVILDIKGCSKEGNQELPPLNSGRRFNPERRLSDLSKRFVELEKAFKRRKAAPPPPPYTAAQKSRVSSSVALEDESERTEPGFESSSVTPRPPFTPRGGTQAPTHAALAASMYTKPARLPPPSTRSASPPRTSSVPPCNDSFSSSEHSVESAVSAAAGSQAPAPPVVAPPVFTSKEDWRTRRRTRGSATSSTTGERYADQALENPMPEAAAVPGYGSTASSAGAFETDDKPEFNLDARGEKEHEELSSGSEALQVEARGSPVDDSFDGSSLPKGATDDQRPLTNVPLLSSDSESGDPDDGEEEASPAQMSQR